MSFYKRSWFVILLLIFFFPVGLFLMWKYTRWFKAIKIIITVFFALIVILCMIPTPDSPANSNTGTSIQDTADSTETEERKKEESAKEKVVNVKENDQKEPEGKKKKEPQKKEADNLVTVDSISKEYNKKLEKIMNKEQIKNLDSLNITIADVQSYANNAKSVADSTESTSEKIDTINKLVSLDDLEHNTSQVVMEDALRYIISEYENNYLANNPESNLYFARYLDKRLDNHPDMKIADGMVFDMFQICKDTIRINGSDLDEATKETLKQSVQENILQIDKSISNVKFRLDM